MCHDSFSCCSPIGGLELVHALLGAIMYGGLVRLLHAFLDLLSLEILKSVT